MPPWTPKRAARARRRPDGTFIEWTGGRTLASLPKQRNDYQGIATHIGELFAREHGRKPRPGDLHRTRTKDGSYNKQAAWYIYTPHGWRKSPTKTTRPSDRTVAQVLAASRPGR